MSWRRGDDAPHSNARRDEISNLFNQPSPTRWDTIRGVTTGPGIGTAATSSSNMPSPSSSGPEWEQNLARLRRFYDYYDPARVAHAEVTLRTWKGSEAVMWNKLKSKYGPEPVEGYETALTRNVSNVAQQALQAHRQQYRSPPSPVRSLDASNFSAPAAATAVAAASSSSSSGNYRARLQRFYAKHAPQRIDTVDKALQVFRGREEDLFRSLVRKFGPEPPEDYPIPLVAIGENPDNISPGFVNNSRWRNNNNNNYTSSSAGVALSSGGVDQEMTTRPSLANILRMDANNADEQPQQARGAKWSGGGDDAESQASSIKWEKVCDCTGCEELCYSMDSERCRCMSRWFYPLCFIFAIIGAIVTALILVGVDRNLVAFTQTKSTSTLDTSVLHGPGLYTWGVNTRAIEFPTTMKRITLFKNVACCGGQTIEMSESFYWTITQRETGFVNKSGLADIFLNFGSIPTSQMLEIAKESISDTISHWASNMSLDELVSNRTLVEDTVHDALQKELWRNRIYIYIPRAYFNLGTFDLPETFQTQKIQVFQNNQTIVTAGYTADATNFRLETKNKVNDIDANTSLIHATAQSNASRMRGIAESNNRALGLANIAQAVRDMLNRVDAKTDEAAIDLFRLNELLDIMELQNDTSLFVGADGKAIFPLI